VAERLVASAHAKINLVLEVTGRREDGYHEIDTVLQTVALADRVAVTFGGAPGVRVSGPYSAGTPADATNLAWRAAEELARRTGDSIEGISIAIDKQIPPAGGLGGVAADAAAVIRLLGSRCGASVEEQFAAANAIGSDEAFLIAGGTARARGRGEQLVRLAPLARQPVVLFVPPGTIERKTARMFAALDRLPLDSGEVSEAFARREPGPVRAADVLNAFERVAFDLFDGLAGLWETLEQRIGEPVHLAGAGPTLFWIGADEASARRALAAVDGVACSGILTATEQAP